MNSGESQKMSAEGVTQMEKENRLSISQAKGQGLQKRMFYSLEG